MRREMKADYTARELARLLHVHPRTVRRLARDGDLPGAYKVGRLWRFRREAVQKMRGVVQRRTYGSPDAQIGPIRPASDEHGKADR